MSWLIFKRGLSFSTIDKVYDVELNQHHCKPKLAAACLESSACHYFKQFTRIGNKLHVSQNECTPVQTVIDIESHQL